MKGVSDAMGCEKCCDCGKPFDVKEGRFVERVNLYGKIVVVWECQECSVGKTLQR